VAIAHRVRLVVAACVGALALLAVPLSAQNYSDGYRFLQAIDKKDQAEVERLINKTSTIINSRDVRDGHTGLHTIVQRRDSQWLRYLLTEGADPNIADKTGVTPLALASRLGWVEGVAILASKGAKPDIANETGETPLIAAVHKRDAALVRMLLAAGADPDRSDNSGRTARDYAKLDGPGSLVLEAIETGDRNKKARKPSQTYGPSF
jgi:ankyrin repeat protein